MIDRISGEGYFTTVNMESMVEENIEPTSAAKVLAFSLWPEDRRDPLDALSLDALVRDYDLFSPRSRHFRGFVERRFPNIYARITGDS